MSAEVFKPSTESPLVGKHFITTRYADFRHNGEAVTAADQRGEAVYALFDGDPSIWVIHRRDLEA